MRASLVIATLGVGVLVAGCAKPTPENDTGHGDLASFFESTADMAEPPAVDMALPTLRGTGGGSPDLATPSAPACPVRINEIATGTVASGYQEFVELFNPCGAVTVSGYTLVYRSSTGTADIVLISDVGAGNASLAANGFLLFGGKGYYTALRDGEMSSGLRDAGGAVGLRDAGGALVDSVGWGDATNAFVEGSVAAAPGAMAAPGTSLARSVDGASTGDNNADFAVTSEPTPRTANVIY